MNILNEGNLKIQDGSIHYHFHHKEGTEPLVLVHGIGVSSRYMLPLAEELAKTNSVYVIDLPGFGKSTASRTGYNLDDFSNSISGFIEQVAIRQPVIIGNSFGCQVALRLIKNKPGLVSKAILIGPTMNIYERTHLKQIGRWLHNLIHEPTRKLAWIITKDIFECGLIKVFKTLDLGIKDRPEKGLDSVKIPILFTRGERDPIAPRKWLEYLANRNSRFSIAELPKAGHALNFNSPKPLAEIIQDYIKS